MSTEFFSESYRKKIHLLKKFVEPSQQFFQNLNISFFSGCHQSGKRQCFGFPFRLDGRSLSNPSQLLEIEQGLVRPFGAAWSIISNPNTSETDPDTTIDALPKPLSFPTSTTSKVLYSINDSFQPLILQTVFSATLVCCITSGNVSFRVDLGNSSCSSNEQLWLIMHHHTFPNKSIARV